MAGGATHSRLNTFEATKAPSGWFAPERSSTHRTSHSGWRTLWVSGFRRPMDRARPRAAPPRQMRRRHTPRMAPRRTEAPDTGPSESPQRRITMQVHETICVASIISHPILSHAHQSRALATDGFDGILDMTCLNRNVAIARCRRCIHFGILPGTFSRHATGTGSIRGEHSDRTRGTVERTRDGRSCPQP